MRREAGGTVKVLIWARLPSNLKGCICKWQKSSKLFMNPSRETWWKDITTLYLYLTRYITTFTVNFEQVPLIRLFPWNIVFFWEIDKLRLYWWLKLQPYRTKNDVWHKKMDLSPALKSFYWDFGVGGWSTIWPLLETTIWCWPWLHNTVTRDTYKQRGFKTRC